MQKGKFNTLVDSAWGSSGKGAASTRLADIHGVFNLSSNNYPNAGHCQVSSTFIITNNGLERLGDIISKKEAKLTADMTGSMASVSDFVDDGIRKTNLISLSNGVTLECTDIHKYYVWNWVESKFEWVESMNLDSSFHQFVFPKSVPFPENPLLPLNWKDTEAPNKTVIKRPEDRIWASYLGLLVGDGYYANGTRVDIAFNIKQEDTMEMVKDMYDSMNVPYHISKVGDKECYVLSTSSVSGIKSLFEVSGLKLAVKDNKTTPTSIFTSSKLFIASYLSGIFDSDGCAKEDRVTFSNCSENLVKDAQQLLYVLGVHSCVTVYYDDRDDSIRKPQYVLSVSGKNNLTKFKESVNFLSAYKKERLDAAINNTEDQGQIVNLGPKVKKYLQQQGHVFSKPSSRVSRLKNILNENDEQTKDLHNLVNNFHIVNINSVEREYREEKVYDITVPSTHSYIANGCISHNTAIVNGHKFVSKVLPTGAILKKAKGKDLNLWLGPGSGFTEEQIKKEIIDSGFKESLLNLFIHERAMIVEQRHIDAEAPAGSQSTEHISSTMSGSGAALTEKAMRKKEVMLARDTTMKTLDPCSFIMEVRQRLKQGDTFLHEVSQGWALSLNHGTHYPTCTSRDCTPQQAYSDFSIIPELAGDVYLNVRSFPIRVGNNYRDGKQVGYSGDCMDDQFELSWEDIGKSAEMPQEEIDILAEKERTTVTKKIRRVFSPSWELLHKSAVSCGATKLILNFPQYIHWSTHGLRGGVEVIEKLHPLVREYVDKMEEVTNLKVVMIGTGADHDDFIYLD